MFILLILIIVLTINNICSKESLILIVDKFKSIKLYYLFILFFILIMYFILHGTYINYTLKILKKKVSFIKCVFYALVEFYFSGITPSSMGGGPVQTYYMRKDNIPIRKSYINLTLNTIYFKLTILILGLLALLFKYREIFNNGFIYIFFFVVGFISDVVILIINYLLLFKPTILKAILNKLQKFISKFKILKKKIDEFNVDEIIEKYHDDINLIKRNKIKAIIAFFITFVQRTLLFSIAYVVYRALGFQELSYFDLLVVQITAQMASEILPIPGGSILSEKLIFNMFVGIFTLNLTEVGMLLTRAFSFYIPLLISGLIIFVIWLKNSFLRNVQ